MIKRVLLTSVCKPIGPRVGDAKSVGYELLHGQVTRAQGIYSPRVVHQQFSLDFIAENLDCPTRVLHYPSRLSFIKELETQPDVVGISFIYSTWHHVQEMCQLARVHAPDAKIVLGGYGAQIPQEEMDPYCDAVCTGEGVAFMRHFLDQPTLPTKTYNHPTIISKMRLFGVPISRTAMVFAGLGCPNGCDFCATSHFFKRQHIKLLPTGEAIFDFMAAQKAEDPNIEFSIIDEDFLLNQERARGFLRRCREENTSFSIFCFASAKALSQYSCDEILEMGIDGVWVGYEGKRSGYSKHAGIDVDELIRTLQDHGISVLTSMILGLPYQDEAIARQEFAGLQANRPALTQFMIYTPILGTPLYDHVVKEQLFRDEFQNDRDRYYRTSTGFTSLIRHPRFEREQLEALQEEFYRSDFRSLGPSVLRVVDVKLAGWRAYRDSSNPLLRLKAEEFRAKLAMCLAILPVAVLGPGIKLRNRLHYLDMIRQILKEVPWLSRANLLLAPMVAASAIVTGLAQRLRLSDHPFTRRRSYPGLQPAEDASAVALLAASASNPAEQRSL